MTCKILYPIQVKSYLDWFDLCDRPNCWTALSALQGNSTVRWTRRRWLGTLKSACKDIPGSIKKTCSLASRWMLKYQNVKITISFFWHMYIIFKHTFLIIDLIMLFTSNILVRLQCHTIKNHIVGVMVSVLVSSVVDGGVEPWSGQTKRL
jgi:hypothetical protein